MTPLEAFALHASTSCQDVCGRSFADGSTEPCPVGECLLSCMGLVQKAARWVEAECRSYRFDGVDSVAVIGEELASGLLACEHLKESAP